MGEGSCYRRLCTRDAVRLVLAPALVLIATSLDRGYQTDYWQHLARGRLIAQERAVVSVDRFTFTASGQAVYDNNWLSQLLYYGVHSTAGLQGVQVLNSLALAATFALLVNLCLRTSNSTALAAAAGVLAFLGLWPTLLIRPQTFSMLLFVALYALLEASARRPRLLLWVPPIMALWANVHGGFAVGLALVFAFVLGAALERHARRQPLSLVSCLLVSAVATLANPYGWGVYRYAGKLSSVGVARGIEEWLPPLLNTVTGVAGVVSIGLLILLAVASTRRPSARELCLLGCFLVPACLSVRMSVWWFLVSAPIWARWAGGLPALQRTQAAGSAGDRSDVASPFSAVALATIAGAAVLSLPWFECYNPVIGTLRPRHRAESDVEQVAAQLPRLDRRGRVFARMEWANYLNWAAPDRSTVFVEGHVELYPDETWQRYLTVTQAAPGWDGVLDAYAVEYLLLDRAYHGALLERVRESGRWSERARSGPAVLFERRQAPHPGAPDSVASGDF